MIVGRRYEFSIAHRLPKHDGKCAKLHGHNYLMEVEAVGPVDGDGVVIWYERLDEIVQAWIDKIDHKTVLSPTDRCVAGADVHVAAMPEDLPDPTAENLVTWAARWIDNELNHAVTFNNVVRLHGIRLHETSRAWTRWSA